jgi:hypothetical protein
MLADQHVAEDMLKTAMKTPGFRAAVENVCAAAAAHGPVVLHFRKGEFYRIELPLE